MLSQRTHRYIDLADLRITEWMGTNGVVLLRLTLGVVFLWFGALKLVPGLSPAEELVRRTIPFFPGDLFVPFLGAWEVLIGVGFLFGRALRLTILLLLLQMPGTLLPVLVLPERVFTAFPLGLTLEGQYIVKNLVLISAALVIGATVRGGRVRTLQAEWGLELARSGGSTPPAGNARGREKGPPRRFRSRARREDDDVQRG